MLGGVAAGIAQHLRVPTVWVRIGFLAAVAFGGFGVVLYAGMWLVLPAQKHLQNDAPGLDAATRQGRRPGRQRRLTDLGPLVAVGAIVLGLLLLLGRLTGSISSAGPVVLAAAGVAVLWRQADEAQRERWQDATGGLNPFRVVLGGGGLAAWLRLGVGVSLLVGAIMLFSLRSGSFTLAVNVGVAAVLGIAGIALMLGPWLFRLTADLSEEREARVRSQERADVAAHLHDSVLQTLALIQRSSADPAAVSRLARAQERDLRAWLFDPPDDDRTTLAAALRLAAAEVEDAHGCHVEVVCVGDPQLSDPLRPLLLAAREAMHNAAGHSGADVVDVYAEAAGTQVEVFVRDRGRGFDPDRVPADRHGVRTSILDRVRRHGGHAEVRSVPGEGTEVRLHMSVPPRQEETQ